jgi:hypothetical protein
VSDSVARISGGALGLERKLELYREDPTSLIAASVHSAATKAKRFNMDKQDAQDEEKSKALILFIPFIHVHLRTRRCRNRAAKFLSAKQFRVFDPSR